MDEMTADTLDGIDAFQRTAGLRVLALVLRAMEETSAYKENVELCGLVVRADFVARLQRVPAEADRPESSSGETLAELLQSAAGDWMLDKGSKTYGAGDPMDGRGAMLGVEALHTELLRYCTSYTADRASWYRWEQLRMTPGSGPAACRGLHEQLKALGQRVRRNELPPQQWPDELLQREYPTIFGPQPRSEPKWPDFPQYPGSPDPPAPLDSNPYEILDEKIAELEKYAEEVAAGPRPRWSSIEDARRAILSLKESRARREFYQDCDKLPPLQHAYDATRRLRDKRRSDSYVGLFTLVQVAAAVTLDMALKNLVRNALAQMSRQPSNFVAPEPGDGAGWGNTNIVPEGWAFRDPIATDNLNLFHNRVYLGIDGTGTVYVNFRFPNIERNFDEAPLEEGTYDDRTTDYRSSIEIRVPFEKTDRNSGADLTALLAELDEAWAGVHWEVSAESTHDSVPTVRYVKWREEIIDERILGPVPAEGFQEWKKGVDMHSGPQSCTAERFPIVILRSSPPDNPQWMRVVQSSNTSREWPAVLGAQPIRNTLDYNGNLALMHYQVPGYGNQVPLSAMMRSVKLAPVFGRA